MGARRHRILGAGAIVILGLAVIGLGYFRLQGVVPRSVFVLADLACGIMITVLAFVLMRSTKESKSK